MDSFAFVIHPDAPQQDVARKHRRLGMVLSEPAIHFASRFWPPVQISHTTVAKSAATGREVEGSLVTVLHTAQRMLALRPAEVYHKKIAQELDVVVGVTCSGGVLLWPDRLETGVASAMYPAGGTYRGRPAGAGMTYWSSMADKPGFKLASLRSLERWLDETDTQRVKAEAQSGDRG